MPERTAREDIFSNIAEFQKLFPGSDIDVQAFVDEQKSRGEQVREQMRLANEPVKKNIFEKILPFLTAGAFAIDATGRDRGTRAAAPGKAAGVFKTIRERRTGKEKAQRQKSLDAIAALEMGGRFDAQSFRALLEGSQGKAAATRSAITAGTAATKLQQKKDAPAKTETYNESRERRGAAIKLRIKHGNTPVTEWPLADQDTWTWATKIEIESPETTAEKLQIGISQEIIKAH